MGIQTLSAAWLRPGRGPTLYSTACLTVAVLALITPVCEGQATSCTLFPGTFFYGDTLDGFNEIFSASAIDCCNKCNANVRCASFTWTTSRRCTLNAAILPASYEDTTATGGVKAAAILTVPASLSVSDFEVPGAVLFRSSAFPSYTSAVLTYDQSQTGLAVLLSPVQLLTDASSRCQAASFSTSFSFSTYHSPLLSPADGFTFFIAASEIPLESLGDVNRYVSTSAWQGFASSYGDPLRRPAAMAIEYDTFRNRDVGDPDSSHIGLNLNYSPWSVRINSTLPSKINFADYRLKYTWIDYDAASSLLNVYLSYGSTKPAAPLLTSSLNLCTTMRPPNCSSCSAVTTFYLGFSGATGDNTVTTHIYSWAFASSWPAFSAGTPPPSSACTTMPGCRFDDPSIDGSASLSSSSPADCGRRCAAHRRCLAYSWNSAKTCDLKTSGDSIVQGDSSLAGNFCGERSRVMLTTPASFAFPNFTASSPMVLLGSSILAGNLLRLTYGTNQAAVALYQQPVQLIRDVDSVCEAASFSTTFSFVMRNLPDSNGGGEGLTFVTLASNLLLSQLATSAGASMGFSLYPSGVLPGSLAVEFDTRQNGDLGDFELATNHVGIDTRYSVTSLTAAAASRAGVSLLDGQVKYVWVEYDGEDNVMAVYLGSTGVKPQEPILTYSIDMCQVLRPPDCLQACQSVTTAYVGFSASTNWYYQTSEILSFQYKTFWPSGPRDTGGYKVSLLPSGIVPTKMNRYFRFASMGYLSQSGSRRRPPSWLVAIRWNWTEDAVQAIKDQQSCSACYAMSAAAAIESNFYLTYYSSSQTVPDLSAQQLVDCLGSGCQGGWPADALDYAATTGLVSTAAYPYQGPNSTCNVPASPAVRYQPSSFEAVSLLGWLGLLLAVQQTPAMVTLEGSKPSFINYFGGIYDDPNCFSRGVDHAVVVVGYDLLSSPPFWILRNSWGPKWGEFGYMRMAIRPGEGICGINTLPAYIPIFRATDVCNRNSYPVQTGIFNPDAAPGRLNPCGGGTCTPLPGGGNNCSCPLDFVQGTNSDGTQTCVPASPCTFLSDNPCRMGTCLNSQTTPGTYTCLCPMGYEQGTVTTDNSTTCVPAVLVSGPQFYTVPTGVSVTCALIWEIYGILRSTFLAQNRGLLDCTKPLPANTVVNVTSDLVQGCALPYAVNTGDTCDSIASLFKLARLAGVGSPNPDLNCTALQPGQQVCIRRNSASDTAPPDIPLCTAPYTVSTGETCNTVIASKFAGDAAAFFSLNPGLYCNNFNRFNVANVTIGQQVCTGATNLQSIQVGCKGRLVNMRPGDTCLTIIGREYCSRRKLFQRYNNNWKCEGARLLSGRATNNRLRLCAPRRCW